jgi:hypothetical protein
LMTDWFGPVPGIGALLLAQDAKVTPATSEAPIAAKREKLIRIEVLSSRMREIVAKGNFAIDYPAPVSPRARASLPRGTGLQNRVRPRRFRAVF